MSSIVLDLFLKCLIYLNKLSIFNSNAKSQNKIKLLSENLKYNSFTKSYSSVKTNPFLKISIN
ncbi:hypothetical protein BpHYR1_014034 [Brachionus plicatilis]|uniref:Uncharacterized protein n=1 Tax=Brachionus plicatilis TaxID=10195 RepID=A0A3M7PC79_BRAPC|nr:hypothetical protein BpHYR1_014034 [Brachionus plicatilis]